MAYKRAGRKTYCIEFTDQHGRLRKNVGTKIRDRRVAEALEVKVRGDAARLRAGLQPEYPELTGPYLKLNRPDRQTWADASAAFLADLRRRGRSKDHLTVARTYLLRVGKECACAYLDELRLDRFTAFLGRLAAAGRGPRTQNAYRDMVRHFLTWCRRQDWLQVNPLAELDPVEMGAAGRRKLRRPFSLDELERLCAAATDWRALVYHAAAYSGFRRSELLRLTREDCTPTGDRPRWHVDGSRTKNGLPARLPMFRECAAALRAHWLTLPPGSLLFPRGSDRQERSTASGVPTWRSLRLDRTAAGIVHKDGRQRLVDFHSLRYTFCKLAAAIYPIEVVSKLMRHSSLTLTHGVYLDLGLDVEGEGAWVLPPLLPATVPTISPTTREAG